MKIIGFDEIYGAGLRPLDFFNWVSEAIYQKNQTILPAKISIKMPEHRFFNIMPCVIPSDAAMGVKTVTRFPSESSDKPSLNSQILLFDSETGKAQALMDGTYITAMRTGAVAVHSIKLFAKKDFYEVGLLGLGITARATFKILMDVFPDHPMKIKLLRYKDHAEKFAEKYKDIPSIQFEIHDDIEDVLKHSDVIVSCVTYTQDDFAVESVYGKGCLIVPVHTRGFMECDFAFDKVFADDKAHVEGFQYFDRFKRFAEVADVVQGSAPGREFEDERILVYNIGLALHDIYIANKIYGMMPDAPNVELSVPLEKYWL